MGRDAQRRKEGKFKRQRNLFLWLTFKKNTPSSPEFPLTWIMNREERAWACLKGETFLPWEESRRKYWLADLRLVFVRGGGGIPFFARVRRAIAESRINYGNDATFSLTGSPSCISPPALCSCFWSPRKSGCTVCRVNRRSAHDCRSAARRWGTDPYLEYREREREKERGLI